ncbi:hypothetical protein [Kitasatospora paracochleata]|uniref:Uncharacterized protein n=1 Tax=Kitasatospora paracochleata TaxID=58354 RepID=A0ABT1IUL2_9ACTN|nr:hypothetical protein [Kitasatospora paracochleata]MCP2308764.1 hypothetical protein [Kitasatospora paracochleata]
MITISFGDFSIELPESQAWVAIVVAVLLAVVKLGIAAIRRSSDGDVPRADITIRQARDNRSRSRRLTRVRQRRAQGRRRPPARR